MGTRCLICVRVDARWAVAQNSQWDGFPTGQGLTLFRFLHVKGNVARLRAGLAHVFEPTKEELRETAQSIRAERERLSAQDPDDLHEYLTSRREFLSVIPRGQVGESTVRTYLGMFDLSTEMFPSLSHHTGGKILDLIADADAQHRVPIRLDLEFAADSFHCAWAYIVDLDEERLKIFGGRDITHEGHPFSDAGDWLEVPMLLLTFTFAELQSWDEDEFRRRVQDYH
ncbi:hypothetical protein F4820DRAFT_463727 [Hypoxylon rubiginosum]|uniref:Uncharacterized protein n=1 Tax=Hypoxylon rubiginosum TaxID=110542 RepID=A0ACB9YTE9_9PEZI|nr:hypothetical protein F4820DRAFT_463727 [Hypoxylon rubiginosum]